MTEDKTGFPYYYSSFENKTDAEWDGDPRGDYILADHINRLQDAIVDIEKMIGIEPDFELTVSERLEKIQTYSQFKVSSYHWFEQDPSDSASFKNQLTRFENVIFTRLTDQTKNIIPDIYPNTYGVVDAQLPVNTFQSEVAEWGNAGANGILILNFGLIRTRTQQQNLLNTVSDYGLSIIIQSDKVSELTNNQIVTEYNPEGVTFDFPKDTYVWLQDFAYDTDYKTPKYLFDTTYPLINKLKQSGLKIIGQANVRDQQSYSYVQATALLFSIDGMNVGLTGGSEPTAIYDWHTPLLDWKTDKPSVFLERGRLFRTVPNGLIGLEDDGKIVLKGNTLNSTLVQWATNSVPGFAIQTGSIPPDRLSSYDVQKIVDLINNSNSDIQIDLTKIRMDDGLTLPANIPAENMTTNVILALNQNIDPSTENNLWIDKSLIKEVNASSLVGKLNPKLIQDVVIPAINATDNDIDNYIDILRLDVSNINLRGSITGGEIIQSNSFNGLNINIEQEARTLNLITSGYHTGNDGEYNKLYVRELTVDKLLGLKDLHVENLTADNIGSLIIDAVQANIETGIFNQIVTKALTADTIKADLITSLNSITDKQIGNSLLFEDGVIKNAAIQDLNANKIISGTINTGQVDLSSPDGHLRIKDKSIKIYDNEELDGDRKLRIVVGDTSDTGIESIDKENFGYGLLVLGKDGTTRLYDHTGIYNAGIHNNAISETKLQDDSISSRVIQAGAVIADHIQGRTITGDKLVAQTITSNEILAKTITAAQIKSETITGSEIKGETIDGTHIKAGSIDAKHIIAGSIDADKLRIGYRSNLVRDGYDSFEQEELGSASFISVSGTNNRADIVNDWAWDGNKSLRLAGPNQQNTILLTENSIDYTIPIIPGRDYIVSAYIFTYSDIDVSVRLGIKGNKNDIQLGPVEQISYSMRYKRIHYKFKAPENSLRALVALSVQATNTEVFFDSIQVEEVDEQTTKPGTWKSTATTRITGSSITTGYVGADHIRIGSGTVFGNNNNIIDITNQGIKAKSKTGYAMLNASGLEIRGGAISIEGGTSQGSIAIDGNTGIDIENSVSQILLNPSEGIKITNKVTGQSIFEIDPVTGRLRFSGEAEFFTATDDYLSIKDMTDSMTREINQRRRVFTKTPVPPYDEGDLFVQGRNGELFYATRSRIAGAVFVQEDWEVATPYTDDSALKEFVTLNDKQQSIRIGMLMHYKDFKNQKLNSIYFCGFERDYENFGQELVDTNGSIYDFNKQILIDVPKQALDLAMLEEGTSGYLVFNYQDKKISFIYYNKEIEETLNPDTQRMEKRTMQEGWFLFNHTATNHDSFIDLGNEYFIIGELTR